ncbi:hypothetical protein CK203_080203 [Vitis vinifera]|uniref:Uncharacterized protein n=1 Tax=Vitis vinifera TaxID=29760 RepID=A0A438ENX1_VITVI|nr:hypothetical protein CK203_080203 [Vitis vinifera]
MKPVGLEFCMDIQTHLSHLLRLSLTRKGSAASISSSTASKGRGMRRQRNRGKSVLEGILVSSF